MAIDISIILHKNRNHSYLHVTIIMQAATQILSDSTESAIVHIASISTDHPTRIRLLGMGIGKGSRIEILRNRQGDIVLGNGNNRISLGRSITAHITVSLPERLA